MRNFLFTWISPLASLASIIVIIFVMGSSWGHEEAHLIKIDEEIVRINKNIEENTSSFRVFDDEIQKTNLKVEKLEGRFDLFVEMRRSSRASTINNNNVINTSTGKQ